MIEITRTGDVHVLTMAAGENRFNPAMLDAIDGALDEVERSEGPAAVVLTGQGKFFSNGLDLEWMMANVEQDGPARVANGLQAIYRRLVTFPVATVAAVNGHAFAGGAMLALACDQRVMRTDRGYFCLPEVDINIPFTIGMSKLIPEEALAAGIVDAAVPEEQVLAVATERAQAQAGKLRATVATIKQRMYGEVADALAEEAGGLGATS
ncbi:MAG: enoyl-CoA hydratase/isomerase family protein [Solirubrobacteraceae bacterium]|nr:enoyl-CoA hydratase/isomerase family protein [Solirubrobacteraceae bacterium]